MTNPSTNKLESEVNESFKTHELGKELDWSCVDLRELLNRLEAITPQDDKLLYHTRIEKLDWDCLAFKNYSGFDCKKAWLVIQKRLRSFRILHELVSDARSLLAEPKVSCRETCFVETDTTSSTAYMLYFLQHKSDIQKDDPSSDKNMLYQKIAEKYKIMSSEERNVYIKMAKEAELAAQEADLNIISEKNSTFKDSNQRKKCKTPFEFYCEDMLKNPIAGKKCNRKVRIGEYRKNWKCLPDDEKVNWINIAEEEYEKYKKERDNSGKSDDIVEEPVLSKKEKMIKESFEGKPVKPPSSPYHLFLKIMLQSEVVKDVPSKERMGHVASMWKIIPNEEKNQYKEDHNQMVTKFKADYATYLQSLSAEKQQEELKNDIRKRKFKVSVKVESSEESDDSSFMSKSETDSVMKKRKICNINIITDEEKLAIKQKLMLQKPKLPPLTVMGYFRQNYKGKDCFKAAWMKLDHREKKKYADELYEDQKAYIAEFEKFLRSLSKEELYIYSM